jgi:replicative DNA helicase
MGELYSAEAEIAVISIIVHNPDLAYNLNGLRFSMFSSVANQTIFSEIESILNKGLVPDISLLTSSLDANAQLERCGGKEYLDYIYTQEFNKENLLEYVNMISASARARGLISAVSSIKASDISLSNVDSKIQNIREILEQISTNNTSGEATHISEGMNDVFNEIMSRTGENAGKRGIPWGFKKLDVVTGGKSPGELWYISGRPGSGKTALMCNAALNDGYAGNPTLIFSKEMNYLTMLERLAAIDSGVPITDIRLGLLKQDAIDRLKESFQRIKKLPIYLDTNFMIDDYYIELMVRKFYTVHNIKAVYVDYMQLIAERDDKMTQTLGRISRMLKNLANSLNISVVALSQLNREVEHRDNKRPIMSDIKQSGYLEEDADVLVGLYRDEYYNKETKFAGLMEFIILKNRNGPAGTITLDFKSETNKIV